MIFENILMLKEQEQKLEHLFKFHIIRPNLGQYMLEHLSRYQIYLYFKNLCNTYGMSLTMLVRQG